MDPFGEIQTFGFLPCIPPLTSYGSPRYQAYDDLMRDLPQRIREHTFRDQIKNLPDISQIVLVENDLPTLHALFRDLTILTSCWCLRDVYLNIDGATAYCVVPKLLALPLEIIAQKLALKPWMDYYTSTVMFNYQLIDHSQGHTLENLKLIRPMAGGQAESNFFLIHVTISAMSQRVISCIESSLSAPHNDEGIATILSNLSSISDHISQAQALLKEMHLRCEPSEFNNFRKLLHGPSHGSKVFPNGIIFEGVSEEQRFYAGASGAHDALLPVIDAFVNLDDALRANDLQIQLDIFNECRPVRIREYIQSVRERSKAANLKSVFQSDSRLLLAVLNIVQKLWRWRSSHLRIVDRYIFGGKLAQESDKREPGVQGTGGSDAIFYLSVQIADSCHYALDLARDHHLVDAQTHAIHQIQRDARATIKALGKSSQFVARLYPTTCADPLVRATVEQMGKAPREPSD